MNDNDAVKRANDSILKRMMGVPKSLGTPETDADPRNPFREPGKSDQGNLPQIMAAVSKTIVDLEIFASSFDHGSASRQFCDGIVERLKGALPKERKD